MIFETKLQYVEVLLEILWVSTCSCCAKGKSHFYSSKLTLKSSKETQVYGVFSSILLKLSD